MCYITTQKKTSLDPTFQDKDNVYINQNLSNPLHKPYYNLFMYTTWYIQKCIINFKISCINSITNGHPQEKSPHVLKW